MKEKFLKNFYIICILLASVCWGIVGLFTRKLESLGLNFIQIASVRIISAVIIFIIYLFIKDRNGFKIKVRDIPLFIGTGIVSILFFTVCYFKTIQITTISNAVILLYTAPIMVSIMAVIFLKEKYNIGKFVALIFSFIGCVLVIGIGDSQKLNAIGILVGLGAGFGYALYSIFSVFALRKYSPMVVTTLSFVTAAIGSLFICNPPEIISIVAKSNSPIKFTVLIFATGLITAVIPFGLYTFGLKKVEASKASIMCSLEPVVATVTSIIVFAEPFSATSILGMVLVISAIIILNLYKGKKNDA